MRVFVMGASGGSGRAVVDRALAAGHQATGFVRDPARLPAAPGLTVVAGDARDAAAVARAAPGHDAWVVALGVPQGRGRAPAPPDICSAGTRALLGALDAPAPRLIVVSAFGVGDTRAVAPWPMRLWFALFLRALFADKERQEAAVKASRAEWTLVHPVALTDDPPTGDWLASGEGAIGRWSVSRADMAAFILDEIGARRFVRRTVALSGGRRPS